MRTTGKLASFLSLLILGLHGGAQADPVPLPDPKIPGYKFPEAETTLLKWVDDPTLANTRSLYLHGWGLWTALTSPSGQTEFGIKNVPVYFTWLTPEEVAALPPTPNANLVESARPPRTLKLGTPKQFLRIPGFAESLTQDRPAAGEKLKATATSVRDTSVFETVGYDPAAAAFASKNKLFSLAALTAIYNSGKASVPDFPVESVTIKPVYKAVTKRNMINGSIYVMPAWPGTPDAAKVDPKKGYPETMWPGCIYIDSKNTGTSKASGVDTKCSVPTAQNTYGLGDFISYPVTAANLAQFKDMTGSKTLAAGDYMILMAMHVTSREMTEWTWQTYFWTPDPASPPLPSLKAVAVARPAQLVGPAAHYAMSVGYQMVAPNQPIAGGKSEGTPVIAFNPYLESGFGTGVFTAPPTNVGIYNPKTKTTFKATLGIQSNCMTCHSLASVKIAPGATKLGYATDFYISRTDPIFKGNLQTEFLWSIADNAK